MTLPTLGWIGGAASIIFILADAWLQHRRSMHLSYVVVTHGPFKGRKGKIVNHSWVGNLYHTWLQLNIAANEQEIRDRWGKAYGEKINDTIDQMKRGVGPRICVRVTRNCIQAVDPGAKGVVELCGDDVMSEAMQYVARLTSLDLKKKTIFALLASTISELGELADAINIEEASFGNAHKEVEEPSQVEAIDLMICSLALYFGRGGTADQIAIIMTRKLKKWESQQVAEGQPDDRKDRE